MVMEPEKKENKHSSPRTNRDMLTSIGARMPFDNMHVHIPLMVRSTLDMFSKTLEGPLSIEYLPPLVTTVPLLVLH